MKPKSLCLIHMGLEGLELVRAFPDIIPKKEMSKIIFQSIPFGANDGDFITRTVGKSVICGYIFSISSNKEQREDIVTLTTIFDSMDFQPQLIKNAFTFIIQKLRENNILSISILKEILPEVYKGLVAKSFKIKISSNVSLEFVIDDNDKKKKKPFQNFTEDIW